MAQIIELQFGNGGRKSTSSSVERVLDTTSDIVANVHALSISHKTIESLVKQKQWEKLSLLLAQYGETHNMFYDLGKYCDEVFLEAEIDVDLQTLMGLYEFSLQHRDMVGVNECNDMVYDKLCDLLGLFTSRNYFSDKMPEALLLLSFFKRRKELESRFKEAKNKIQKGFGDLCKAFVEQRESAYIFFSSLMNGGCEDIVFENVMMYLKIAYDSYFHFPPEEAKMLQLEVLKILGLLKGANISFDTSIAPHLGTLQSFFSRRLWGETTWEKLPPSNVRKFSS